MMSCAVLCCAVLAAAVRACRCGVVCYPLGTLYIAPCVSQGTPPHARAFMQAQIPIEL
jgi:hypothetical protein